MRGRIVAAVGLIMAMGLAWRWRTEDRGGAGALGHSAARRSPAGGGRAARVEPRTLARGSIRGAVTDARHVGIAGARVCAVTAARGADVAAGHAPVCATTDAAGRYQIADLIAARYAVHASAALFISARYRPSSDLDTVAVDVGEEKRGVDLVLARGGVEVSGLVADIMGGVIAHAWVRGLDRRSGSAALAVAETDAEGRFSLWVAPGELTLEARADGYAPATVDGSAPRKLTLVLMAASSLSGVVVDAATGQPVAAATVELEAALPLRGDTTSAAISDAQGRFRIAGLPPGRFTAVARAAHRHGRTEGSVGAGFAEDVDGVVIRVFAAHRVAGKVVVARTGQRCARAEVTLFEPQQRRLERLRGADGGELSAEGVLPGTYQVSVACAGFVSRVRHPDIIVAGDVSDVVWEVEPGARVRGKVRVRSGAALAGVELWAHGEAGAGLASRSARSEGDGRFELAGLAVGRYRILASTNRAVAPPGGVAVTIAGATATVEQDLVLDVGGAIVGHVVDDIGAPVPDALVVPVGGIPSARDLDVVTDVDGGFAIAALAPGVYRVAARRDWQTPYRKPGGGDQAAFASVTVRAGETATVKVVVAFERGTITGTVVDAANQPVGDAFLTIARELGGAARGDATLGRWQGDAQPVTTSTGGGFRLTRLAKGSYTVRAYRRGGGEAIAEHVATGSTVRLQILRPAVLAGVLRGAGAAPVQSLTITVIDRRSGFARSERFDNTGGRFALRDLPAGHFEVTAETIDARATLTVDLAAGEARTVELVSAPLVTLTGRLVAHGTQRPLPGVMVHVTPAASARSAGSFDGGVKSDPMGRFSIARVSTGPVSIEGISLESEAPTSFSVRRTVRGAGTVDLGEIHVAVPRVIPGQAQGVLGVRFAGDDAQPRRSLVVSQVDPASPAGQAGLRVGDVITSCDGFDVTGDGVADWFQLVRAPPGTRLTIGTQRGVVVTVALAAP